MLHRSQVQTPNNGNGLAKNNPWKFDILLQFIAKHWRRIQSRKRTKTQNKIEKKNKREIPFISHTHSHTTVYDQTRIIHRHSSFNRCFAHIISNLKHFLHDFAIFLIRSHFYGMRSNIIFNFRKIMHWPCSRSFYFVLFFNIFCPIFISG